MAIIKSIKYIGYYSINSLRPKRSFPLAGRNKMDYTISVLNRLSDSTEIVSAAQVKSGEKGAGAKNIKFSSRTSLRIFSNISNRGRFYSIFNYIITQIQLFLFLIRNTNRKSIVLVYHSILTLKVVLWSKKIRRFKLILELNEIYSDATEKFRNRKEDELKIIKAADAYIFPNDLMNSMFNPLNKPFVIEYGIYRPEKILAKQWNDGKIHIVYAGTLDPEKGGAQLALTASKYLPINYHLHILGFGSLKMIKDIETEIESLKKVSHCNISYDGCLDGDDFISFLQKCHIGISTQNPNAKFNDTSFPSKILTYFACGLQVVSINIPVVKQCSLNQYISFYDKVSGKEIADTILKISDFKPHYDLLRELDVEFETKLSNVLNQLSTENN